MGRSVEDRHLRNLPVHMRESLKAYVERGIPVGDFLRLCIENDYYHAAARADVPNQYALFDYIYFFHNYAPAQCHGSPENYNAWIKYHALEREEALKNAPAPDPAA